MQLRLISGSRQQIRLPRSQVMPGKLWAVLLGVVGASLLISPTPAPANSSPAAAAPSPVDHPGKGWAILRFEVRADAPLDSDDVVAVRASSDAFAQFAR